MSTSIDTAFIKQYESEVKYIFQREGGYLRNTVRLKTGIVGTSTTFQKVGKGIATTKARHGVVTPMNGSHTAIECTVSDFYAGDWVDKLDEAKTNIDERTVIARSGAYALGRKVDDQIITALGTTTQSAVSWTVTSKNAIRNAMLAMAGAMDANDVPNDGRRFGALTAKQWQFAMTVTEFSSRDFVDINGVRYGQGAPNNGKYFEYLGIKWFVHTGLSGAGTASAVPLAWHADAIGYATGKFAGNNADNDMVAADIDWQGDRAAHFVNHMMSGGAALIDDTGVIKGAVDDTASLPTS